MYYVSIPLPLLLIWLILFILLIIFGVRNSKEEIELTDIASRALSCAEYYLHETQTLKIQLRQLSDACNKLLKEQYPDDYFNNIYTASTHVPAPADDK